MSKYLIANENYPWRASSSAVFQIGYQKAEAASELRLSGKKISLS
jgi:hypothetical protein